MRSKAAQISHHQPGDPERLAEAVVALVDAPNPPVRLPLGSDTIAAIEAKHLSDAEILAAWRPVSVSTDFPSAA